MDKKFVGISGIVLNTIGVLLLLAAAFDAVPVADNALIFAALALFLIASALRRLPR